MKSLNLETLVLCCMVNGKKNSKAAKLSLQTLHHVKVQRSHSLIIKSLVPPIPFSTDSMCVFPSDRSTCSESLFPLIFHNTAAIWPRAVDQGLLQLSVCNVGLILMVNQRASQDERQRPGQKKAGGSKQKRKSSFCLLFISHKPELWWGDSRGNLDAPFGWEGFKVAETGQTHTKPPPTLPQDARAKPDVHLLVFSGTTSLTLLGTIQYSSSAGKWSANCLLLF